MSSACFYCRSQVEEHQIASNFDKFSLADCDSIFTSLITMLGCLNPREATESVKKMLALAITSLSRQVCIPKLLKYGPEYRHFFHQSTDFYGLLKKYRLTFYIVHFTRSMGV